MPSDVAAGGAGRGDGHAGLDGDLVGIGFHGDLDGLARVRQADLDPLAADHDRTAHRGVRNEPAQPIGIDDGLRPATQASADVILLWCPLETSSYSCLVPFWEFWRSKRLTGSTSITGTAWKAGGQIVSGDLMHVRHYVIEQ